MNDFLSDPFVQMVMAICTFVGGIVTLMQLFAWYEGGAMPEQSEKINSEGEQKIPLWIARENHIFKKSFHAWNYRILKVLYSGNTSSNSFLNLAYLLAIPYFLMTFVAITFPYWMVAVVISLIVIRQSYVYFDNAGRSLDDSVMWLMVLMPFGAIAFFYFAPEWTVVLLFPLSVISALLVAWERSTRSYPVEDWTTNWIHMQRE